MKDPQKKLLFCFYCNKQNRSKSVNSETPTTKKAKMANLCGAEGTCTSANVVSSEKQSSKRARYLYDVTRGAWV